MNVEKWHGAGNDFVVVDGRELASPPEWKSWTRAVCDRRRGIGADGVLVLETHPSLDFRMHYRNADGGVADMCGNGGRVLAAFAVLRGLGRDGIVRFESAWGEHEARVREREARRRFEVWLTLPDVPAAEELEIEAPWGRVPALYVSAGVPHLVVDRARTTAKDLDAVDILGWGQSLRSHARLGSAGANVDFLERQDDGSIAVRTYERGVEGETLACGTGATASASASVRWGWGGSPVRVRTRGGDVLAVSFDASEGALHKVMLAGPAMRMFEASWS